MISSQFERTETRFHKCSWLFLKGEYDTTFIDTRFDKEDLKRRQNTDPTVAVIAAAVRHYEREKEAASRATTLPVVGESLWKYYGKLQMTANNYWFETNK